MDMIVFSQTTSLSKAELTVVLRRKERAWTEESKLSIVRSMMEHIGATDSELRDDLIYSCFWQLISENELKHEVLIELLHLCLSDQFLLKGIEENGTDTVFTRSFTTLLIALILRKDNEDHFLTEDVLEKVKDSLLCYIHLENDVRGYVPIKGWAHSVAHAADAFDQLVQSQKINIACYPKILNALWQKIFHSSSVYIHGEDERVLRPIISMIDRGLTMHEVVTFIETIPMQLRLEKDQLAMENYLYLEANCKAFLKSFYIKLTDREDLRRLRAHIEASLKQL
jgi:hypothetical protein